MAILYAYLASPAYFLSFEYKIKDLMFMARGAVAGDERIVIVDIDEKSLKELGQWPWSRDKTATLLENLKNNGASIIGLDIVFAEPDSSSPKNVFKKLGLPTNNIADYDALLAHTIANTPTVAGYIFVLSDDGVAPENPPYHKPVTVEQNRPADSYLIKPYRAILNLPSIDENAYASGYFNMTPDIDGIVRSVPLVMDYQGGIYPSLSLEMMRLALGANRITIQYDEKGINHIRIGELIIPTDYFGKMRINYRGPQKSYHYISAIDIYRQNISPNALEGKIVLVGTSAAGLMDLRSTPLDNIFPGVEVHANLLDNMINQNFLIKPVWVDGVDILSILLLSFITFILLLIPSAFIAFTLFILINLTLITAHYHIMTLYGILLNTLLPLFAINTLFVAGQVINYFLETKQKEKIKNKFARKVSPAVMNDILKEKGDVLSGKERDITIFFSDMRNFTNISESLGDPHHLIRLLNIYMDPMTEIIVHSGGTVDKFIGDAIMAYWNAPLDVDDHPDKAVKAALEQLYALKSLNEHIRQDPEFASAVAMADQKGTMLIDIGIGINTGRAVVGEMGSSGRSDYTVIGDTINLASRLESLCKYYNSRLNISHFTKERLKEKYFFRFLDLVTVKGKADPVEIWQIHDYDISDEYLLTPKAKKRLRDELLLYHEGIEFYRNGAFSEAVKRFREIDQWEDKSNQAIYKIYIERCEHYLQFPPESFNGVFIHTTKG